MIFAILVSLLGTFLLTAINYAFHRLEKRESEQQLDLSGNFFLYRPLNRLIFSNFPFESLFFTIICSQNIMRFFYAASSLLFLTSFDFQKIEHFGSHIFGLDFLYSILFFLMISFLFFIILGLSIGDLLPKILGSRYPTAILRLCLPPASFFLFLLFPINLAPLKIIGIFSKNFFFDDLLEPQAIFKQEIMDIIHEADTSTTLNRQDKELIEAVVTFRDRIVREVMVPRVDLFSLSADVSIKEAAELLEEEGYSRTPVYRNNVDNIAGVLMYKDILNKYREYDKKKDPKILEAPIESLVKNVIYTPETQKISHLLQEFRKKQMHLAIVVDEHGGTEGIVTIEDILEEIVGEISDEYDQEEALFQARPEGGWVVDARMNILDIEEELGIKIPQDSDYDTVGGYIFHRAGMIPTEGFVIHHDDFELEILASNDRCIEKVHIIPKKN